nr:MAG TPA: hypothetical protein [Crassvirales sp.]
MLKSNRIWYLNGSKTIKMKVNKVLYLVKLTKVKTAILKIFFS